MRLAHGNHAHFTMFARLLIIVCLGGFMGIWSRPAVGATAAFSPTPYRGCGILVPSSGSCLVALQDDESGAVYTLDLPGGLGAFQLGDHVFVAGLAFPSNGCDPAAYIGAIWILSQCGPGPPSQSFCFGNGSDGAVCPCGNTPASNTMEGCAHSGGVGAFLTASGDASVVLDSLVLTVEQGEANMPALIVQNVALGGPVFLGDGSLCLATDSRIVRHHAPPAVQPIMLDASGRGATSHVISAADYSGMTNPGTTVLYQAWFRSPGGPCGGASNVTSGLAVIWN